MTLSAIRLSSFIALSQTKFSKYGIAIHLTHPIFLHNAHLVHFDERLRHKKDVVRNDRGEVTFFVADRSDEASEVETGDGHEDGDEERSAKLHHSVRRGHEGPTRSVSYTSHKHTGYEL